MRNGRGGKEREEMLVEKKEKTNKTEKSAVFLLF
jgi:hypothetical protein